MVQGALVYYFTYIFGDEGLFQLALIALLSFSLLGEYHGPLYGVIIMGATGIGLSTHYVMPHAILPDVVEYGSIKQTAEEGRGCSPVFGLSPAR
jgi:GPH family glycoside/pentoside/hexuronide:cation symporter